MPYTYTKNIEKSLLNLGKRIIRLGGKDRFTTSYPVANEIEKIKELRKKHEFSQKDLDAETLKKKIYGAWVGRACGCLLGKPVECIRSDELIPLLKETGNYPLSRYMLKTDITDDMHSRYKFYLKNKAYADTVDGMPVDDDTNYVVLAQKIVEECGRDFSTKDVGKAWLKYQSIYSYFTAERIAYINLISALVGIERYEKVNNRKELSDFGSGIIYKRNVICNDGNIIKDVKDINEIGRMLFISKINVNSFEYAPHNLPHNILFNRILLLRTS